MSKNGTLADFTEALPDFRVERLWDRLKRELKLPDGVDFATYIQPPREVERTTPEGIKVPVKMPEQIVFLVVSPNPQKRWKGKLIKSMAFTSMRDWHDAEKEAQHFAGFPDPALGIFRALCREHMAARQHWMEMN